MLTQDIQYVLALRPAGLVFDIDGTFSPIAPTPAEARLYPGVASLLEQARNHPNIHIAIITGRAVDNGAAIVNVEGLTYIGTHGLEWSDGLPSASSLQIAPEALLYIEPGKQLLDLAEQQLTGYPGLIVERKRVGGAIHYRLSPNPEAIRRRILTLLTGPAEKLHMRLEEGKRVIEVKAPVSINKGKALRNFVQRFALRGVVFAGDDRTDLDAVMEIARLRQEGMAALSVVVKHADTLPALLEHADVGVEGVEGMVHLLREMVTSLDMASPS